MTIKASGDPQRSGLSNCRASRLRAGVDWRIAMSTSGPWGRRRARYRSRHARTRTATGGRQYASRTSWKCLRSSSGGPRRAPTAARIRFSYSASSPALAAAPRGLHTEALYRSTDTRAPIATLTLSAIGAMTITIATITVKSRSQSPQPLLVYQIIATSITIMGNSVISCHPSSAIFIITNSHIFRHQN